MLTCWLKYVKHLGGYQYLRNSIVQAIAAGGFWLHARKPCRNRFELAFWSLWHAGTRWASFNTSFLQPRGIAWHCIWKGHLRTFEDI